MEGAVMGAVEMELIRRTTGPEQCPNRPHLNKLCKYAVIMVV
jgi:hypothetical protein